MKLSQEEIESISLLLVDRIQYIFQQHNISIKSSSKSYFGSCYIHGGDNAHAFTMYKEKCNWYCWTHGCHKIFGSSILGFLRGILSKEKRGWKTKEDITVSFYDTIKYSLKILGKTEKEIIIAKENLEKRRFSKQFGEIKQPKKFYLNKSNIRNYINVPANFYLDKGYKRDILDMYDVGYYKNPKGQFINRVIVPIYDENNKNVVGVTARTILPYCDNCCKFHNGQGCNTDNVHMSKWTHSTGFLAGHYLYNFHNAKNAIKDSHSIILVESPGNVWKLAQNGINNAVALFGNDLSEEQYALLIKSGALCVNILLDNDEAGRIGTNSIKSRLGRSFNINIIEFDIKFNDISEMSDMYLQQNIIPRIVEYKI